MFFGALAALTGVAVLDAVLSSEPRVVYAQPPVVYSPPPVAWTPPPVVYSQPPVVYTQPVLVEPVCRPVYVVPQVTYYQPAYFPARRPMCPYGGGWRR